MRVMVMVKATSQSEAGKMPDTALLAAMGNFNEELAKAGVLLDGNGLKPSSKGFRIIWSGGKKTVVDGPFAEGKELVAGYTVIQVKSEEEAREWARRFPNPYDEDGEIEIRPLYEIEDLGGSDEWNERIRATGISRSK